MSKIIVTAQEKTESHPYFGKGSKIGYVIDGEEGKELSLVRGNKYKFVVKAPGHPLYFSTSAKGGKGAPRCIKQANKCMEPVDDDTFLFTVDDSLPNTFYYCCSLHEYMGGKVNIVEKDIPDIQPDQNSDTSQDDNTKRKKDKKGKSKIKKKSKAKKESPSNHSDDSIVAASSGDSESTPRKGLIIHSDGFYCPTVIIQPIGDDSMYVADQTGVIQREESDKLSLFCNIRDRMLTLPSSYDERGLLGFTFHPEYSNKKSKYRGRIYLFYSAKKDMTDSTYYNHLSIFQVKNGKVNMDSEKVLLRIKKTEKYHNGGRLAFGPDGYLYITVGDGGPQKDPRGHAQNLSSALGKILRIDVNTDYGAYNVPESNPFVDIKDAVKEIYAYGFRNPWSISFDSNGRLFVADVGYETTEEINLVVKGGNYGWNIKEGSKFTSFYDGDKPKKRLIDPIYEYADSWAKKHSPKGSVAGAAVIGGYYIPDYGYIFGDYGGLIMRIYENPDGIWELTEVTLVDGFIVSFGVINNDLYVSIIEKQGIIRNNGKIYRFSL